MNPFVASPATSTVSRRKFLAASSLGAAWLCLKPLFAATSVAAPANVVAGAARWIRPVIGSSTSVKLGEGKTFPGPCAPFGMVQLGPDTVTGGDNASGYSYEHTSIEGFSLMRMSGVGWYGDFGNLMTMPTTGPMELVSGREVGEGWRSGFTHDKETMEAGYYSVELDKYDIRVELTASARAGVLRFTYPKTEAGTGTARIQIDLARRIGGTSTRQYVKVVDEHAIEGWVKCPEAGGGWGNGAGHVNYTLFYRVEFSKPLRKFGVWSVDMDGFALHVGDEMISDRFKTQEFYDCVKKAKVVDGAREMEGDHLGFYTEFATEKDERVMVKVGVSFVDVDGARGNLRSEIGDKSFEAIRGDAVRGWDSTLGAIAIEGATEKQRGIFSTALYHAMLDPRVITDVDGRYRAADGAIQNAGKKAGGFTPRTIFSGWDVFRGELPLMTILKPELVNDQICTLLEQAELSGRGYLERWEIMGAYSGCMDGDPATSVILDAYQKGIRKFDLEKAYAACRQTAAGVGDKTNRPHNDFYLEHGYVPEQVSWTLDNAYFDWCVGQLAKGLGKTEDAKLFTDRGQNYRKIYDPEVQSMRAKDREGKWIEWKGRTEFGQGCTESNPLQQSWFVPHDVPGLIATMGAETFVAALEDMFEKTPETFAWNSYYNHSNEPVHHIPYFFVYAGKPWLTQKWARKIVDHAYGDEVNGIPGNDDVGQMSAWYVLSAMGFYPVCPGDGIYILGSPLFVKATIKLDRKWHAGGSFTIEAKNNSAVNCYIQSAMLNGKPLNRAWIRHAEIVAGGKLELVMGPKPNERWGVRELPGMQA